MHHQKRNADCPFNCWWLQKGVNQARFCNRKLVGCQCSSFPGFFFKKAALPSCNSRCCRSALEQKFGTKTSAPTKSTKYRSVADHNHSTPLEYITQGLFSRPLRRRKVCSGSLTLSQELIGVASFSNTSKGKREGERERWWVRMEEGGVVEGGRDSTVSSPPQISCAGLNLNSMSETTTDATRGHREPNVSL